MSTESLASYFLTCCHGIWISGLSRNSHLYNLVTGVHCSQTDAVQSQALVTGGPTWPPMGCGSHDPEGTVFSSSSSKLSQPPAEEPKWLERQSLSSSGCLSHSSPSGNKLQTPGKGIGMAVMCWRHNVLFNAMIHEPCLQNWPSVTIELSEGPSQHTVVMKPPSAETRDRCTPARISVVLPRTR